MYYLYVKTHTKTGLKYLGQTSRNPIKYKGSGVYWRRHVRQHGSKYITTEIIFETPSKEELKVKGLYYSVLWDVVNSTMWANLKEECGDGGFDHINGAKKHLYIQKAKDTIAAWPYTKREMVNRMKARQGQQNGMFGIDRSGKNNPMFGKEHSKDTKIKISNANKDKRRSPEVRGRMSEVAKEMWTEWRREQRSEEYKKRGYKPPSSAGKLWWNNTINETRQFASPGDGWNRGRLKVDK